MNYNSVYVLVSYLLAYLVVWTFALTSQGAITAWISNRFGDETAKNQGRISLSPFVQLDLIGSVVLPGILFIFSWLSVGIPFVAWGKPIPIDWEKIGKSGAKFIWVSLAATMVNLGIGLISILFLKILFTAGFTTELSFAQTIMHKDFGAKVSWLSPIELMLWYSVVINISLTFLSLIPIPPLAGGAILNSVIKERFVSISNFLNRFGLIICIVFLYFVAFPYILSPILINILQFLGLS